jgi:uncharacterized protein YcbK (DUF882 family)
MEKSSPMPSAHYKFFDYALSRRGFLVAGALVAGKCLFPAATGGAAERHAAPRKSLYIYNLHTSETLKTVYREGDHYVPAALKEIDYLFRDHRTQAIHPIDTGLLDLLYTLNQHLETDAPFHLICGYRSPETNAMLRKRSRGVAKKSYHLKGQAVDIRLPGLKTAALRKAAVAIRGGGVGYYPRSGFVHMDVGPVRFW